MLNLISAGTSDCNIYGNCKAVSNGITNINNSYTTNNNNYYNGTSYNISYDAGLIWFYNMSLSFTDWLATFNYNYNTTTYSLNYTHWLNFNASYTTPADMIYPYNISDSSLMAFWAFNNATGENATYFKDELGRNNGTCSSASGYCPVFNPIGIMANATTFDGINDVISVPVSQSLHALNALTVSAWIKESKATQVRAQIIISKDWSEWTFRHEANGANLYFKFVDKNGTYYDLYSYNNATGNIADTNWHHVAVVINTSNYTFYIDGNKVGEGRTYFAEFRNITANPFKIGSYNYGGAEMNGSIDEIRLYNRTLNATEMSNLYSLGSYHNSSEGIPAITYNATLDFDDTVLFAKDYRVNSLIYTGDALNDVKKLSAKDSATFSDIDYSKSKSLKGFLGISWLIKAVQQIVNRFEINEAKINSLETENQRLKDCAKEIDYKTYSGCILK